MAKLNDNFTLRAPVPVDDKLGWWDEAAGAWKPFTSRQDAIDKTPHYRFRTMTLPVEENGDVVEYWFKWGVEDEDLVLKTSQADLSNYYTKTELQTSGDAQIHWDNLTNVPSIQSPLTFENGLREDGGVVKLGLDLSTIGTTNKGLLTEDTYLFRQGSDVSVVGLLDGLLSIVARDTTSTNISQVDLSKDIINIQRTVGGNIKSFTISSAGFFIHDNDAVGLGDAGDYSANKTAYSYVTKMMLDAVAADIPDLTGYATEQWVLDRNYLTGVTWGIITGDQSVIGNAGFNNTANYITLADVPSQVQTDWLATTGLASILNKPVLATVATTGDYDDLINKPSIPDLTGYATEAWVISQGYLDEVPWAFDVNTGDLTIDGITNNLDGRWLERADGVITSGYGITVNGDLATGMGIEVNTTTLDNRYLRKDVNDANGNFKLTTGELESGDATFTESVTLTSVGTGTGDEILLYGPGGVIQRKTLNFEGSFGVANSGGTKQFDVDLGTNLRFAGTGDTVVSFNSSTNTITINSVPGQGGGGVITSVFGRTTPAILAETGDYNTSQVPESGNLYFTQARVRSTPLTGYSVGINAAISASDTILSAFGKTQGQINARVPTSRTISISGTSGNISISGTPTQNLGSNAAWTINLATVGSAGANKTKVTTDAYGRVIASAALTLADLPSTVTQTLTHDPNASFGNISISGGNTINLSSIIRNTSESGTWGSFASSVSSGLKPFASTTGSTGFPSTASSGFIVNRNGAGNVAGAMAFGVSATESDVNAYFNVGLTSTTWTGWKAIADKDWVTSQIPTNYVTTNTGQTGLVGNKNWSAAHKWGTTSIPTATANSVDIGSGGANGMMLRITQLNSTNTSAILRGYSSSGVQLELNEGGVNISTTSLILSNGSPVLTASTNTIVSAPSSGQVYLRPNGASSATNEARFSDNVVLSVLSGTGTQMVVANPSGVLSRQAIPAVGVTSVSAGNGMNFTTITGTGAVTLGTPGTLTASTSNGVTSTSHTHAITTTTSGAANTIVQTNASGVITASGGNSTQWNEAYGWGDYRQWGLGTFTNNTGNVADANTPSETQFFSGTASTTNKPPGTGHTYIHIGRASTIANQLAFDYDNDEVYFRRLRTTWQPWRRLWHDGNFNPSSYQTTITGAATTIVSSNLTANRALISNGSGKVAVSAVTSTELGYLDGVTSNIQTQLDNRVTTNTSQTGIAGNKSWTGNQSWTTTSGPSAISNAIQFGASSGSQYIRIMRGAEATQSIIIRGYSTNGIQLVLNDGGINIPTGGAGGAGYYIGDNVALDGASNYILLSAPTTDGIVYIYPNGRSSSVARSIFTPTSTTIGTLTGTGTQMIVANSSGVLSRQAIPAVGVTSVAAGNGMNFTTITGTGSVTLGTPGSITLSSTNAVTSTSHTHAFSPGGTTSQYIRGDGSLATFPSIPSVGNGTLTMSTGTGLTGSATFSANQSSAVTFSVGLAQATATTRGGIEIFSNTVQSVAANAVTATASRTYGIQVNSAGQAVVNVPWTNTNTTYSNGNGLTLSGTVFSLTAINAGSGTVGAVRYNGTTRTAGSWYGGTTSPTSTTRLNYDGDLYATNIIASGQVSGFGASDYRLKTEIQEISNPFDILDSINGYSFKWNNLQNIYKGRDYGVIAQEVKTVLPEIVEEVINGVDKKYLGIRNNNALVAVLIQAVKQLKKEVEELRNG